MPAVNATTAIHVTVGSQEALTTPLRAQPTRTMIVTPKNKANSPNRTAVGRTTVPA